MNEGIEAAPGGALRAKRTAPRRETPGNLRRIWERLELRRRFRRLYGEKNLSEDFFELGISSLT